MQQIQTWTSGKKTNGDSSVGTVVEIKEIQSMEALHVRVLRYNQARGVCVLDTLHLFGLSGLTYILCSICV